MLCATRTKQVLFFHSKFSIHTHSFLSNTYYRYSKYSTHTFNTNHSADFKNGKNEAISQYVKKPFSDHNQLLEMKWDNETHTFIPSYRFSNTRNEELLKFIDTKKAAADFVNDTDSISITSSDKKRVKSSMLYRNSINDLSAVGDQLVQSFLASLQISDLPRAQNFLESMIKDGFYRYQLSVQENCFILLLHYSFETLVLSEHDKCDKFLDTSTNLLRFYTKLLSKYGQKDSYPYKAFAFILHRACTFSSHKERLIVILKLENFWKKELDLDFSLALQYTDMLTELDLQVIKFASGLNPESKTIQKAESMSQKPNEYFKDFSWRNSIGESLDEVLSGSFLDVKSAFGEQVYQESLVDGKLNYLKLYNTLYEQSNGDLSSPLLMQFERLFDDFNRRRQYDLEMKYKDLTFERAEADLDAEMRDQIGKQGEFKRASPLYLQKYLFQWKKNLSTELKMQLNRVKKSNRLSPEDAKEYKYKHENIVFREMRKHMSVISQLGSDRVAEIVTIEMIGLLFGSAFKSADLDSMFKRTAAQLSRAIGERIEAAQAQLCLTEMAQQNEARKSGKVSKSGQHTENHTQIEDPVNLDIFRLVQAYSAGSVKGKNAATRGYARMIGLDHMALGATLITLALESLTYTKVDPETKETKTIPAFIHEKEFRSNKLVGIIRPNTQFLHDISKRSKILNKDSMTTLTLSKVPPMLAKPKPWDSSLGGGYWYNNLPTLGNRPDEAPEQYSYVSNAIKHNKMDRFIGALNGLSQCAWAVNPKILNVLLQIWESGHQFLDIPGSPKNTNSEDSLLSSSSSQAKPAFDLNEYHKRSHRLSLEYILRLAEMFGKNGDRFYYPYRIDFRGRVYPLSNSGFWHIGSDSVRSLFMFWYGKPLGKSGLDWLKIHLANMYGVDKVNRKDQIKFVDDNWDDIVDSAKNPVKIFSGTVSPSQSFGMWWTKADKPFQVLATCFELVAAVESGDPENYVSRLCVAQDGTCNGLQHYAALGRDITGATEVNLIPQSDIEPNVKAPPRDIYSKVRDIVAELVESDATNGLNSTESTKLANDLRGHITRKIVKRPVMTSVYGVTRFGTAQQIKEELRQIPELDPEMIKKYSLYLTEKVFKAYSELFGKAQLIQRWLEDCALRICESVSWDNYGIFQQADELRASPIDSKAKKPNSVSSPKMIVSNKDFMKKFMTSVIWTTPLGLPVVQPYRQLDTMEIVTPLQRITVFNPIKPAFIVKSKQINGIAPNFIHSLDSTHLLMTAEEMSRQNLEFASVHDSFWTHAGDVNSLSQILRDKFVELHRQDLVESLYNEWKIRYDGYFQLVYIDRNSEAGKQIQNLRDENTKLVQILNMGQEPETKKNGGGKRHKTHNSISSVLRYELFLEYQNWCSCKNLEKDDSKAKDGYLKRTPSIIAKELNEPVYRIPDNGIVYGDTVPDQYKSKPLDTSDFDKKIQTTIEEPGTDTDEKQDKNSQLDLEANEEKKRQNRLSKNKTLSSKWMPLFVPLHIPKLPKKEDFDIELVKQSDYFFK